MKKIIYIKKYVKSERLRDISIFPRVIIYYFWVAFIFAKYTDSELGK